jgi:hypothetical protein
MGRFILAVTQLLDFCDPTQGIDRIHMIEFPLCTPAQPTEFWQ